ncbi:helix-turn-helix domain-containing protein [Halodesulfovibrio aestuarii]|uniref:Helix-turn-helix domain-containing protein n=1 Tax=Halodesulfovibrio aestuarii TaxID=126333 RepID=A0ABV4JQU3_9BACT
MNNKPTYTPEEVLGTATPARLREGLTQEKLATAIGYKKHHSSEMENNKRPIGKNMAQRLAEALNTENH